MSTAPPRENYELAVIGAGPAGLAAASTAAALGIDTVLFDEQRAPGGQIYRAVTETPVQDRAILGEKYWHGLGLVEELQRNGAAHVAGATVWSVSREREIGVSVAGAARLLQAKHVIVATGALERPFPIPGWTLPGVMTVGAAQIMLKSGGLVGAGDVVLAGTGPLLWLYAAQLLRAGGKVAALLDTTPRGNWTQVLTLLPEFLRSQYRAEGLALMREVKRQLRVIPYVSALRAEGGDRVRELRFRQGGREQSFKADLVLLHQGVVPNVNLAVSIGCQHRWDEVQLCFRPALDEWGASSVEGVAIAGDGAGIGGAEVAEQRGRLAALDAALRLGKIDQARRDREASPYRHALQRARRGRTFLDAYFRSGPADRIPEGDTIVCRCEEVTAQQIVSTVALGCVGPNQMKSFLRCGMGPCQGRLCGLTVTELIAHTRGVPPGEVGYYRLRPPVKPITVAELAALPQSEAAVKAVVRG
jgi:NADPH-dependent 2,4-dienoyl-CoA reductase/sulfur reductase-like enzyme